MGHKRVDIRKKRAILASISKGATIRRACEAADTTDTSYYKWLKEDQEFAKAVERAKESRIQVVEDSLLMSALGGGTVSEVRETVVDGHVVELRTIKELPASVGAQIFFLKTQYPEKWSERVDVKPEDHEPTVFVVEPISEGKSNGK